MLNPNIFEQVFRAGDDITGAPYTGTVTSRPTGHIFRQEPAVGQSAIVGGEIGGEVEGVAFRCLTDLYVFADDATDIELEVETPDHTFTLMTESGDTLIYSPGIGAGFKLLPGWKLKVKATLPTGVGTAGGYIMASLPTWFIPLQ